MSDEQKNDKPTDTRDPLAWVDELTTAIPWVLRAAGHYQKQRSLDDLQAQLHVEGVAADEQRRQELHALEVQRIKATMAAETSRQALIDAELEAARLKQAVWRQRLHRQQQKTRREAEIEVEKVDPGVGVDEEQKPKEEDAPDVIRVGDVWREQGRTGLTYEILERVPGMISIRWETGICSTHPPAAVGTADGDTLVKRGTGERLV